MIVTGMLLRAAGFATMAMADALDPVVLLRAVRPRWHVIRSAAHRFVIKLTRPHERGRFFSLLMMQDSAGAVVGALIGSWLLQYDFHFVCWVGAAIFIAGRRLERLATAGLSHLYRAHTDEGRHVAGPARSPLPHLCPDADRLLHAGGAGNADDADRGRNEMLGSPAAVKWMYAIMALSLSLLYLLARWGEKHFRLEQRPMAGLLLMTPGSLLPIGLATSLQAFTADLLLLLGSIIAEPARETLSASARFARAAAIWASAASRLALGGALIHRRRLDTIPAGR
ncbi:hypothetical protein M8494_07625 [Serratia ureilytica]